MEISFLCRLDKLLTPLLDVVSINGVIRSLSFVTFVHNIRDITIGVQVCAIYKHRKLTNILSNFITNHYQYNFHPFSQSEKDGKKEGNISHLKTIIFSKSIIWHIVTVAFTITIDILNNQIFSYNLNRNILTCCSVSKQTSALKHYFYMHHVHYDYIKFLFCKISLKTFPFFHSISNQFHPFYTIEIIKYDVNNVNITMSKTMQNAFYLQIKKFLSKQRMLLNR